MPVRSRLEISDKARKAALPLLQARLVDAIALDLQIKQAHWNVKGRDFYQLHKLFDDMHNVIEEFVDTIAERIIALGEKADGRASTVSTTTSLPEYPLDATTGEQHLEALAKSLGKFGALVRADIDTAADAGEQDTADIFTGVSREVDKQLWFVEAHLA